MSGRAPRYLTILVAVLLVVVGFLGTFGGVLPAAVGAWALIAATVVMLLGVLLPGL